MNKRYTLVCFLLFAFVLGGKNIMAQCASGTSGLAVLELEAPNLDDIEPLIVGEEYSFVFSYNYLFTAKLSDCVDEESVMITFDPPGSVDIVNGPNVAGAFITFTIVPNSSDFFMRVTADDCPASTNLSCASAPIRELTVPVEFINLDAQAAGKGVNVSWATASEINNEVFEIQRAVDDQGFETIGTVKGSGNTTTTKSYQFTDAQPENGVNYYRLKQIDYNGVFDFSDVVSANFASDGKIIITPNPVSRGDRMNIIFNANDSNANGTANISVYNIAGKRVMNQVQSIDAGNNNIEISNTDLAQGLYILSVELGNQRVTRRVVIQ